jgi:hypothetical protein
VVVVDGATILFHVPLPFPTTVPPPLSSVIVQAPLAVIVPMMVVLLPLQIAIPGLVIAATGRVYTVIVTGAEVAGLPLLQTSLEVSITYTWSPLAGVKLYVGLFEPTGELFLYHWYKGEVPSLIGYAVNVTVVPVHTGLKSGVALTLTATTGYTVTVTLAQSEAVQGSDSQRA